MTQRRFFMLGCQRTGTTLMRLILECHSQIVCFDEGSAYAILAGQMRPEAPPSKNILGFKIPNWTEQMREPELLDHWHRFAAKRFYENEPLIFLLRDVRDTVASMVKLKAEPEKNWLETWAMTVVNSKIERSALFRERFASEIELLRASSIPNLAYGALYWKLKTAAYFWYVELGLPVAGIRYEHLVTAPEQHLRRVTELLEVEWEPSLLEHTRHEHTELFPSGMTVGNTDPTRPIAEDSVGQWEKSFTAAEIEQVMAMAGDLNERVAGLAI